MDRKIQAIRYWPLWWRGAVTAAVVVLAYLVQIPLERQVPGEPFLLFSFVVISASLAFGSQAGFIAVGLSTILSIPFFEPYGSLTLVHAADLINVEPMYGAAGDQLVGAESVSE